MTDWSKYQFQFVNARGLEKRPIEGTSKYLIEGISWRPVSGDDMLSMDANTLYRVADCMMVDRGDYFEGFEEEYWAGDEKD